MDAAKPELLAFSAFPREHWSTKPIERVNKEIERRSRIVEIFPNSAPKIRLVGAVLLDMHDEWLTADRPYLSAGPWPSSPPSAILLKARRHRRRRVGTEIHLKAHHSACRLLSHREHLATQRSRARICETDPCPLRYLLVTSRGSARRTGRVAVRATRRRVPDHNFMPVRVRRVLPRP